MNNPDNIYCRKSYQIIKQNKIKHSVQKVCNTNPKQDEHKEKPNQEAKNKETKFKKAELKFVVLPQSV